MGGSQIPVMCQTTVNPSCYCQEVYAWKSSKLQRYVSKQNNSSSNWNYGDFPESLSRAILAGIMLVGRLYMCDTMYVYIYIYIYIYTYIYIQI